MIDLFSFDNYKSYLIEWLDHKEGGGGRGARGRLAQAISCPASHVAQVLGGPGHFSLEHGEAINQHLRHVDDQARYFLFLMQFNRAGTNALRERLKTELERIQQNRLVLKNRFNIPETLPAEHQTVFYSAWYYSAIHALASIPRFNTAPAIADYLNLELKLVFRVLQFLTETGLLIENLGQYRVGTSSTYLGSDSPLISKHHVNWRLQALRSFELPQPDDLHYSSVVSLSGEDAKRIREMIIELIEKSKAIIRRSPEERLQCLSADFFQI